MIRMILMLIGWIIQRVFFIAVLTLPWVARILVYAVMLMFTAFGCLWHGFPRTVEIMANDWLGRAINAGFPLLWERYLYHGFSVIAVFTIAAGWIVIAFITICIVNWMF
jgi:hypothetical protein